MKRTLIAVAAVAALASAAFVGITSAGAKQLAAITKPTTAHVAAPALQKPDVRQGFITAQLEANERCVAASLNAPATAPAAVVYAAASTPVFHSTDRWFLLGYCYLNGVKTYYWRRGPSIPNGEHVTTAPAHVCNAQGYPLP